MYKLWVIAHREYVAMVGTKAFVFTLVMMPILMFGSFLVLPVLTRATAGKTLKIVIADGTGKLLPAILEAAEVRNRSVRDSANAAHEAEGKSDATTKVETGTKPNSAPKIRDAMNNELDFWEITASPDSELDDAQRLQLSTEVRNGDLYAFVEIPASLVGDSPNTSGGAPKFYSQDALISGARMWITSVINDRMRQLRIKQFALDSIDPKILAQIDAKTELVPTLPLIPSANGEGANETNRDPLTAMFLPFGVMMLMFLVILMAAQPMLETAMEEKGLRIAEVLLGSVSATQLMGGKLIGNVAASLLIFVLYGAGSFFFLNLQGMGHHVPLELLPWFLLFQVLGVLFFSSIFLMVGVSVNDLKEAQSLLLPVWMVLMAPMMIWVIAIREPNGVVATALSFFPPSCPMMMVLRLASGTVVPAWQPPLAALMMILATAGVVMVAGRIYRNGLLRADGVRSISQLIRRSFIKA